jgi:hypothetical protein
MDFARIAPSGFSRKKKSSPILSPALDPALSSFATFLEDIPCQ